MRKNRIDETNANNVNVKPKLTNIPSKAAGILVGISLIPVQEAISNKPPQTSAIPVQYV